MTAVELLTELRERGAIIEANGDHLRIDTPKGVITPELCEALMEQKTQVLALLTIPEDEIAWRVEAMLPQIPDIGPIPFLVAKQGSKSQDGHCLSCEAQLNTANAYRCSLCGRATNLALELSLSRQPGGAKNRDEKRC